MSAIKKISFLFVLLLPIIFISNTKQVKAADIELYNYFETQVTNNNSYTNPFFDVDLNVQLTSPSSQTYDFFGFYDGNGLGGQTGNIWKIRFMCMEQGTWNWQASFSDNTPGSSGTFNCVSGNISGPLKVNPNNNLWFQQSNGNNFYPKWYNMAELPYLPSDEQQNLIDTYLGSQSTSGYNYNMVSITTAQAKNYTDNNLNSNTYETPIFSLYVNQSGTTDYTQFDLNSWKRLDNLIQSLAQKNVYVYFYDGIFNTPISNFPTDTATRQKYVKYYLAREGAFYNTILTLGTGPISTALNFFYFIPVGRYFEQIDPFNKIFTVYKSQNVNVSTNTETWIKTGSLAYPEYFTNPGDGGTASDATIANNYIKKFTPVDAGGNINKPVLATEVSWEGTSKLTPDELRHAAWGIATAGGALLYTENNIGVGTYGTSMAKDYIKILNNFMETSNYSNMQPCKNATINCLSEYGKEYIVYFQNGSGTVDLYGFSDLLKAEWIDPKTGTVTQGTDATGGSKIQQFNNPLGDTNDWVLHLTQNTNVPNINIIPNSLSVNKGNNFTISIDTNTYSQLINSAGVHLNFDPGFINVVSTTPGTTLITVLDNRFDNTLGTTDYSGGLLASTTSGQFNLINIEFQALKTGNTTVTFSTNTPLRISGLLYQGNYVNTEFNQLDLTINLNSKDLTGDGNINILDIIQIINYIFAENKPSFVFGNPNANPDINEDNIVNIIDVIALINIIFS